MLGALEGDLVLGLARGALETEDDLLGLLVGIVAAEKETKHSDEGSKEGTVSTCSSLLQRTLTVLAFLWKTGLV